METKVKSDPQDDEILAGIESVAREHLEWNETIDIDARLIEDLGLDSLRLLTLSIEVENRFQVALDEVDEEAIETVRDLVQAIRRKLSESS